MVTSISKEGNAATTDLRVFDPWGPVKDSGVSNSVLRVRFHHAGLRGVVTVASTHLPFQTGLENAPRLYSAFWGGVDAVGCSNYVVAGDYNIDAGHALLHGIVSSCPVPPARLLLFSDGQFTARNVRTGARTNRCATR